MGQIKTLSLRLDSKVLSRIDRLNERRRALIAKTGLFDPDALSRAGLIRWALDEGLAVIEGKLKKGAAR